MLVGDRRVGNPGLLEEQSSGRGGCSGLNPWKHCPLKVVFGFRFWTVPFLDGAVWIALCLFWIVLFGWQWSRAIKRRVLCASQCNAKQLNESLGSKLREGILLG